MSQDQLVERDSQKPLICYNKLLYVITENILFIFELHKNFMNGAK